MLASKSGMPGRLGGDTTWTGDPKWPKETFQTMWHHAQYMKLQEEGEHLQWWCLSSWDTVMCDGAMLTWMVKHLPAHGEHQINFLFCFARTCSSSLLIKLSESRPTSFLASALPVLSPVLLVGKWGSGYMALGSWLGKITAACQGGKLP